MRQRSSNQEFVDIQKNLRKELLHHLLNFNLSNSQPLITCIEESIKKLESIINEINDGIDKYFFKNYQYLLKGLFHLFSWGAKELNAEGNSENHLKACKANISQIEINCYSHIPEYGGKISKLYERLVSVEQINEIKEIAEHFINISFPYIHTFNMKQNYGYGIDEGSVSEKGVFLISIQFTIDDKPWANPQILRPEEIYIIKGKVIVNQWPDGCDVLVLGRSSTLERESFELSLPEIKKKTTKEYSIQGTILFKYPQNSFDDFISVRLLAYFSGLNQVFPTIIGYDQLILKVLDPNIIPFPTGYKIMNKIVLDISNKIDTALSNIDSSEKTDFLTLFSGIVNYQGFCLQQGIYKGKDKVPEDTFRDNLIQHLIARENIGDELYKEPHLSGGRVEINYRGIVVELKVENKISDREKLFEKYGKQPVAYASGNMKQLSILCILDLTEKKNPPAPPQNNVFFKAPVVHGFEENSPSYESRIAFVVIDGNTVSPSTYS